MNEKEMEKVADEMKELLKYKNKMYGDKNVIKMGKMGIITRIEEKLERLKHMLENNLEDDKESKEESWKDIAGFGIIGVMLERGRWDK